MVSINWVRALGVEPVGRIEELEVGLVEVGDRDRFQFQAVARQRVQPPVRFDRGDIVAAFLVHLVERHFGGHRAQGTPTNLPSQQVGKAVGLHGATAQGRGGGGDRRRFLNDADEKLGLDIDPHTIACDDRVLPGPCDTGMRTTLRLTGVTSWTIGRTSAPPLITTVSPPNPVRTKATSLLERRYSQFSR